MESTTPFDTVSEFDDSRVETTEMRDMEVPDMEVTTLGPPGLEIISAIKPDSDTKVPDTRPRDPRIRNSLTNSITIPVPPFSKWFHHRGDPVVSRARKIYLKVYLSGLATTIITVFCVFPIYWGALWKVPVHALNGWVVDFDGGDIGATFTQSLLSQPPQVIKWESVPASRFPDGASGVIEAIKQDHVWVAVVINRNASFSLQAATSTPNSTYNGASAVTVYGAEARNENAYRDFIRPVIQDTMDGIKLQYAIKIASALATSGNGIISLMITSPQTLVNPASYTLVNVLPFDQPVASASVFVGLIYLLILSFYIVNIAHAAREAAGLNRILALRSLITVRLLSSMLGYLCLSFFYALLNLAFKLDLDRRYGHSGFMIFWMLTWIGMLSVGLTLESLITILTPRFIPFFVILWIISNVSVCVFPIDMLPRIFHYGYAAPFYNISNSIRSLAFGTRDTIAMNFGVLFAWVAISCTTLPLLQWYIRRRDRRMIEAQSGVGISAMEKAPLGPTQE